MFSLRYDIVLMTDKKHDMELLQVASNGQEWDVRYINRKCKMMEFSSET